MRGAFAAFRRSSADAQFAHTARRDHVPMLGNRTGAVEPDATRLGPNAIGSAPGLMRLDTVSAIHALLPASCGRIWED